MVTSHFKEFVISFEEEIHKTGFLLRLSLDPPSAIHKASENTVFVVETDCFLFCVSIRVSATNHSLVVEHSQLKCY